MRPENCLFVSEVSSSDNWSSKVVKQNVLEQVPACIKNNGSEENSENSDNYVQNLVEKNLWISRVYAKKYAEKYASNYKMTLDVEDLEQEGNIGLIAAAQRFDSSKGCSFTSYAVFWVEKFIRRAIEDTGELIRKPASQHEKNRKVHKFDQNTPLSVIANETGLNISEILFVRELDSTEYVSISEKVNASDENTNCWEDVIADDCDIAGAYEEKDTVEKIKSLISGIEDEESRKIMMWYIGWTDNNVAYTCPQIAKMTGQTKYRIRKTVEDVFRRIQIQF